MCNIWSNLTKNIKNFAVCINCTTFYLSELQFPNARHVAGSDWSRVWICRKLSVWALLIWFESWWILYSNKNRIEPRVSKGEGSTPTPSAFCRYLFCAKSKKLLLGNPRGFNSAHFKGSTITGGGPMPELSFDHPSQHDQLGTRVAVCDQLFIYSTVNIFIISK